MKKVVLLSLSLLLMSLVRAQTIQYSGPTTFCQGDSLVLTAGNPPVGATLQWTKNNAVIAGATASTFSVLTSGSYSVVATVGLTSTYYDTVTVIVNPKPVAGFTFSPNNICISSTVSFTNTSSGSGISSAWNFGDPNSGLANTSTATNPSHRFIGVNGTSPQSFKAKLTVTSSAGCKAADSSFVTVTQSPGTLLTAASPTVYQAATRVFRICASSASTMTFQNASSTAATNLGYRIVWGDGSPDFTAVSFTSIAHTYSVGTRPLLFIVTGAGGCVDTAFYTAFVGSNPAVSLGNPGNTSICSADSLQFPITGTSTNTDGTLYTISFNDGTPSLQYTHPAVPASVGHVFASSSCGVNSSDGFSTFTNSFSARIVASNPCGTSSGTVVPIYVSQKPEATFTLSRDTACINNLIAISSTSPLNYSITDGNCTPGKNVWLITPSTGWTLQSGVLGSSNGSSDPAMWTNGTSLLSVIFTTPGTYSIKLITGNDAQCKIDSVTHDICVNPTIVAGFALDHNAGCAPLAVGATNSTNLPFCGANTYAWSVTYSNAAGCLPNVANWAFTGGTNASSIHPQFVFNTPGVYSIRLISTSPAGGCTDNIVKTVTVADKPNASISFASPVCEGGSITPTALVNDCYSATTATFLWTLTGGVPATSTALSPGSIQYPTAGAYSVVFDATNACGTTTVTKPLQVNPLPDVILPPNKSVCAGSPTGSFVFSSSLAGTTYSWTNNNTSIGLAASGTGNIASFTAVNAGATAVVATITVTPSNGNGCTGPAGTYTITVSPLPAAPSVTSPVTYCQQDVSSPLVATAGAGNTLSWYTTSTGGTASATAPTPSTAASGTTTYYVSQVVTATGCEGPRSAISVTVKPKPVIGGTSHADPTTCGGLNGSITLTGLAASTTYSGTYSKNGGAPIAFSLTTNGAGSGVINGLGAGIYSNLFVTLNGCSSSAVGPFTLSDPNPPAQPTAGSNSPVCTGTALQLTAVSATGGVSYSWTGPNAFTSAQQNPVIATPTVAASGNYQVTATLNGCTSTSIVSVVVNQTPVTPVAGNNGPVCTGSAINLSATSPTPGVTWSWTGPAGFASNSANPSIAPATASDAGVYTVVASLGSCSSPGVSTTVTVNPVPSIGATSHTDPVSCNSATGTIVLTGLAANTLYSVTYTKNAGLPVTVSLTSSAAGVVTIPLGAGTYTNVFVTSLGCASAPVGPFVLADPAAPAAPVGTGNGPVCSTNDLTLFANSATPGVTYSWNGPAGFTSAQQNPVIPTVTVAQGGLYSVTATLAGCTSAAGTVNITVNPTPSQPVPSVNSPVCEGATLTFSATSSAGATFAWTGPNAFASGAQNPVISPATLAATGTYSVSATLGACTSPLATITATVNVVPVIGGATLQHPTQCATATGSITLTGLAPNLTYTVVYTKNANPPVTVSLASNGAGNILISGLGAGTYSAITVTRLGCSSAPAGPFTLNDPNPPAAPATGSNGPICSGQTLSLTALSATVGVSYSWSGPNGFNTTTQNPTIAAATTAASGLYTVTVSLNNCTATGTINVVVNQTPPAPTVTSPVTYCQNAPATALVATGNAGATVLWYTTATGGTGSAVAPVPSTATIATVVYYASQKVNATGCEGPRAPVTVNVTETPAIGPVFLVHPSLCASATGSIRLTGLTPLTLYTVSYTFNGTPFGTAVTSNASGDVVIPSLFAGTYTAVSVTIAGCPSNVVGPFVLTDPNPPAMPVTGANSPLCEGAVLNLTASSATPGPLTYTWTSTTGFTSASQNPSILNVTPAATGRYFVTATRNNCVSPTAFVDVVVVPLPPAPVASPVSYCIGTTAVPLTATPLAGNTLRWYTVPTGGIGSAAAPTPSTASSGILSYYVSQLTPLGCEGPRTTVTVTIHPDALAQYNYSPDTSCAPFNINASVIQPVINPARNATYEWYANGVLIGTGTSFPGYVLSSPGDSVRIKLRVLSPFGCLEDTLSHKFFTRPVPVPSFTINNPVGCGPLTVQVTNTTPQAGLFTFTWDFGNGLTSNAANPGPVVYLPNPTFQDTVYQVTMSALSGCSTLTVTKPVTVKSKPKAVFTPDHSFGCSPMTVVFTNGSLGLNNVYTWNFDDGSPAVVTPVRGPVTRTFNTGVRDTFNVTLTVVNGCGTDVQTFAVIVSPNTIQLHVAVNGNEVFGCAPHVVRFFNNSTGATSFFWTFGDGGTLSTTSNIETVTHTYANAGVYPVSLRATNGCADTTAFLTITVYPKPTASFALNRSTLCLGDALTATNTTQNATRYDWDFGDGFLSTQTNPSHIYTTPGNYRVMLRAYRLNPAGTECVDTTSLPVTVTSTAAGQFTATPQSGTCAPLTVTFTNQTIPALTTSWDFGDGQSGTGSPAQHTYAAAGTYNASLTVTTAGGCTYSSTRQIIVAGPSGTLQYTGGFNCDTAAVRFEVLASNTDDITWHFGDGSTQTTTARVVFHNYQNPGAYLPFVTLNSNAGCRFEIRGVDSIRVDKITGGFTATQQRACGLTHVVFADTSRAFYGKAQIKWNFGDNTTGTGANVTHDYAIAGSYLVTMIVVANSGCTDTTRRPIDVQVSSVPVASIQGPATGCADQDVTFTGVIQSADPVTLLKWQTSNGLTSAANPFTPSFALPGTYTISLIVGTANGCFDTAAVHTLVVRPTPTIVAGTDQTLCVGSSATLTATGGTTYNWTPLQGLSCTSCPNPVATPLASVRYKVQGTNVFGCSQTDSVDITVMQPFTMTVSADDSICVGQSSNLLASGATTYAWTGPDLTSNSVSNPVATPALTTTYRVVGFDGANCFTDTAFVTVAVGQYPVVKLGPDLSLATGTVRPMVSSVTNGPITNWLWSPGTDLSCTTCPLPSATIKHDITYIVKATTAFGCTGSDTITIKPFCTDVQAFVPNAFTPDGDGVNDILMVRGSGIAQVKTFRIFNRWGEVVFERGNFAPNNPAFGWDGKVKGIYGQPDVYVYTLEVICENGVPFTYKGNVSVLK